PLTVRAVVQAYVAKRDEREARRKGRRVRSDAAQRLSRYVLGQEARGERETVPHARLSDVSLHALTEDDLQKWRDGLPSTLKSATKQRTINDLKAALNDGYAAHRRRLDASLPAIIKHGLKANGHNEDDAEPLARENQILSDTQ